MKEAVKTLQKWTDSWVIGKTEYMWDGGSDEDLDVVHASLRTVLTALTSATARAEAVQAARAELDAAVEHHQYHIDQIEAALQDVYPTWNDHEFPGDWLTKVTATIRQLTPAGLCKVCGAVCDIYPDPPEQGTCYEHCEDHYFQVVDREARCYHCNQPAPDDWYDSEDV